MIEFLYIEVSNMEIQKIFSEIDTNERLYSVLLSEDELALFSEISVELEQREFNSKAAKQRNAKFFEDKGKERLKKSVKEGTLDREGMSEYFMERENYINRNRVNSKINKLRKSWLKSAGSDSGKARKAYEEAEKFEVGYGEQPINEAYKKLGVTKKNLTTGDVFKGIGRSALKEEAQEIAKKQKSKISRGAILAKKIFKELR